MRPRASPSAISLRLGWLPMRSGKSPPRADGPRQGFRFLSKKSYSPVLSLLVQQFRAAQVLMNDVEIIRQVEPRGLSAAWMTTHQVAYIHSLPHSGEFVHKLFIISIRDPYKVHSSKMLRANAGLHTTGKKSLMLLRPRDLAIPVPLLRSRG